MTDLEERYGTRNTAARPVVLTVAALLVIAGLGWLLWTAVFYSTPAVQSRLVGYDVVDQHGVEAVFTVVRSDRDVEASCLLRAFAVDNSVVGELNVQVTSSEEAETTLTRTVRTERGATGVELIGCTAPGQPRPR